MLYSSPKAFSSSVILFSLSSPSCSNFILEMTLESPASFLFRSSQIWCRLFSNFDGYRRFFISISLSSLFYLLSEFPILYTYLITLFSCSNTSYSLLLSSTAFHKVMPTYMWSGAEETVWQIWVDFWLGLVILGNLQFRLDSFCFFIYERREQNHIFSQVLSSGTFFDDHFSTF